MPPYWSLGWHQCRYGYKDLTEVETVVQQYKANNIPLDTMWYAGVLAVTDSFIQCVVKLHTV